VLHTGYPAHQPSFPVLSAVLFCIMSRGHRRPSHTSRVGWQGHLCIAWSTLLIGLVVTTGSRWHVNSSLGPHECAELLGTSTGGTWAQCYHSYLYFAVLFFTLGDFNWPHQCTKLLRHFDWRTWTQCYHSDLYFALLFFTLGDLSWPHECAELLWHIDWRNLGSMLPL